MESGEANNQSKTTSDAPPPAPTSAANSKPFKGRYSCLNDPNLAPSRIYVGNLAESITEEALRNRFEKYGQIKDMLLKSGFAFIQFMAKDSAMEAIQRENKTTMLDKIIAVRTAVKKGQEPLQKNQSDNQNYAPPAPNMNAGPSAPQIGPMKRNNMFNSNKNNNNHSNTGKFTHKESSNHIEIMVMTREAQNYAENIETYLKERNLKVDLLFPNPDAHMPNLLDNIKARGTLFALEVDLPNQQDETVTVYLLYDEKIKYNPNMPVQEALDKVQNCTEKYLNSINMNAAPVSGGFSYKKAISLGTVVEDVNNLIHEKRATVNELDDLIEKIRKMRQALAILENPSNPAPEPEIPEEDPAELELQKKINNIVNAENYLDKLLGKKKFEMTDEKLALLKDPKIERALDTLLHPDIFSTLDLKFIENYVHK